MERVVLGFVFSKVVSLIAVRPNRLRSMFCMRRSKPSLRTLHVGLSEQMTHCRFTIWLTYWGELSLCRQHLGEDGVRSGELQHPAMAEEVAAARGSAQQPVSGQTDAAGGF